MQIENTNKKIGLRQQLVNLKIVGGEVLKGDKGDQGIQGIQGPQGLPGKDGLDGKQGPQGIPGKDGLDGRGIKSISLINTKDKVKTYRIEFTDGTSFDFQIKDGEDGKDGEKGIAGGAILKGVQKVSNMSQDYTSTSEKTYPSSKALHDALEQAGGKKEIIELSGESGILTDEQIAIVKDNTKEYLIINDGEAFYLVNTQTDLPYKTYINLDIALTSNVDAKALYIHTGEEGVTYKHWSKESISFDTVDVVDNLNSTDSDKALSANMGHTLNQNLETKENASNKVTSVSSSSTDTQYPTAKCLYTMLGNVESLILAL